MIKIREVALIFCDSTTMIEEIPIKKQNIKLIFRSILIAQRKDITDTKRAARKLDNELDISKVLYAYVKIKTTLTNKCGNGNFFIN